MFIASFRFFGNFALLFDTTFFFSNVGPSLGANSCNLESLSSPSGNTLAGRKTFGPIPWPCFQPIRRNISYPIVFKCEPKDLDSISLWEVFGAISNLGTKTILFS